MKNILLAAFFIVTTTVSMAQSKVGTVDVDFILTNMTDELKKVNDSLANYEASLSAQLKKWFSIVKFKKRSTFSAFVPTYR